MDEWLERYASVLGEPPPRPKEVGAILKLSRDVAHGVERKLAPLSSYLVGQHVGRALGTGGDAGRAFREAVEGAESLLPPPSD